MIFQKHRQAIANLTISRFQFYFYSNCLWLKVSMYCKLNKYIPWYKLISGPLWSIFWVHHKQHVWEAGAKVSPICVMVAGGLGCVGVLALRAVEFHHSLPGYIRQT